MQRDTHTHTHAHTHARTHTCAWHCERVWPQGSVLDMTAHPSILFYLYRKYSTSPRHCVCTKALRVSVNVCVCMGVGVRADRQTCLPQTDPRHCPSPQTYPRLRACVAVFQVTQSRVGGGGASVLSHTPHLKACVHAPHNTNIDSKNFQRNVKYERLPAQ